jgi:peptidoglycan/LPS O-acetylase OafA/YrhL
VSSASVTTRPARTSTGRVALAAVLDIAFIVLFVAIGRRSHDEDSALVGFLVTLWPFLAGAAIGWIACLAWRAPLRLAPTAVVVWGAAVVGCMLLRILSGQGVQWSFVIVTAVVLGLFLVGWRAVALLVRRIRSRR